MKIEDLDNLVKDELMATWYYKGLELSKRNRLPYGQRPDYIKNYILKCYNNYINLNENKISDTRKEE
ncbi:MAG: hypothetical protein AABY22_10425 [Nanoarchaeota archaeon]